MPCALQQLFRGELSSIAVLGMLRLLSRGQKWRKRPNFSCSLHTHLPGVHLGIHHLPWLQMDSLPPWILEFPAFAPQQRSGCPGQSLGSFWTNLRRSRSSSCSYTPTCKHSGRQITTIHNKTKLLGFSFVPVMKVIKLHAKRQGLGGMESRA